MKHLLKINNLFAIVRVCEFGILAKIAGVKKSPVVYVPVRTRMMFGIETSREKLDDGIKKAKFFRVHQCKGHSEDAGKLDLYSTDKGYRVDGWGGVRLSKLAYDAREDLQVRNSQYIVNNNTPEAIQRAGIVL